MWKPDEYLKILKSLLDIETKYIQVDQGATNNIYWSELSLTICWISLGGNRFINLSIIEDELIIKIHISMGMVYYYKWPYTRDKFSDIADMHHKGSINNIETFKLIIDMLKDFNFEDKYYLI